MKLELPVQYGMDVVKCMHVFSLGRGETIAWFWTYG